jgi:hypothetical protein
MVDNRNVCNRLSLPCGAELSAITELPTTAASPELDEPRAFMSDNPSTHEIEVGHDEAFDSGSLSDSDYLPNWATSRN